MDLILKQLLENSPNPAQSLANYMRGYIRGYALGTMEKLLRELKQEGLKCETKKDQETEM